MIDTSYRASFLMFDISFWFSSVAWPYRNTTLLLWFWVNNLKYWFSFKHWLLCYFVPPPIALLVFVIS
jgi:hypothetical protein